MPPTAVAGAAVLCAAGAWLFADPLVLRGLVAAAAAAAVTGAVFMRGWDRSAGRQVAELARGRESDQWKTEERVAELEADVEESRELRGKLDAKLRAKRVELAKLRGEHAALLRRYATAETERATALEGRRQLALEAAAEPKALTAASDTASAAAYLGAARALDELARNGAAQQARRTVEAARARDLAERATEAEDQRGKHAADTGAEHSRPVALPATRVPTASAIVPYSPLRRPVRPEGGFDFFGAENRPEGDEQPHDEAPSGGSRGETGEEAGGEGESGGDRPGPAARLEREDLADVVGEEALAERRRSEDRGVGQVIDLTAHDETERLELGELRGAVGS
ncbi:hypothetical protein DVH02_03330 [Streptomyces corynorhini]|uniref:Secreted protein n=1 Tax=Streptomyces corynorhini TaxID=2282652 RepID=A0A370BCQ9_9ACTN|nr:hypothetical protein DVH02_03330 [Streptomyces corynorhini]